jgi:uracil-DNA glycosylase
VTDRLEAWAPDAWPVGEGWSDVVHDFLHSHQGRALAVFMRQRLAAGAVIYPPTPFQALELTPLPKVRAVVLGQDPYHGPGQAHGLAFSVKDGVKLPPSLRNIFKELAISPANGSLVEWANRGVLLLNASLTVEHGN